MPAATGLPTVWVFEDQLSLDVETLAKGPRSAHVLLVESDNNFRRVPFHQHRIVFLISAMRHFAGELRAAGWDVHHSAFREKGYHDAVAAVKAHLAKTGSREFWILDPSEHHTRVWIEDLLGKLGVTIRWFKNTMFLTDREEFADWATNLKSPVMEFFYRRQREKFDVLMEGTGKRTPVGGVWNFDKENRKVPRTGLLIPPLPEYPPDAITREVMTEVNRRFPNHPGDAATFNLPVTRKDAQQHLSHFLKYRLPSFGDFEDAMVTGQPVLFHSFISPQLNAGLLTPMECIRGAETAYQKNNAPLNAVEGFIRQILGWREYVYGIYHSFMPDYRDRNSRKSTRPLPDFFWDAKTDMNCLRQTLEGVIDSAYSHHIQRLMILCNFSTLAGLSPQAVNDWFYAMYADSHDWVVTPNVVGMGMAADGGTMATKPYISAAAYINKMSDYCKGCRFDPKVRTGENACPFNFLFWTFLDHYRALYAKNPRMTMMLKNAERVDPAEMKAMMKQRKTFLESLPSATYGPGLGWRREERE